MTLKTMNLTYVGLTPDQQSRLTDKDIDNFYVYARLNDFAHKELLYKHRNYADDTELENFFVPADIFRRLVMKYQLVCESIYNDKNLNNKYLGTAGVPKALRDL